MTVAQVDQVTRALAGTHGAIVSVFAGRIADTGRDPIPIMAEVARDHLPPLRTSACSGPARAKSSTSRQADDIGVDIITVTPETLTKLGLFGKSLDEYSLDTVRMFFNDAQAAGFTL